MEKLKQQLVEVEKQREEHGDTIGKLKQVCVRADISRSSSVQRLQTLIQTHSHGSVYETKCGLIRRCK